MRIERNAQSEVEPPQTVLPQVLNDGQQSIATHRRGIKQLVKCRRNHAESFNNVFQDCLLRLLVVNKRDPSAERLVKFVASFAAYRVEEHAEESDSFLEGLLGFLLRFSESSQKSVRFRVCQILSEVMLRLGDDVELSDKIWDELIAAMQRRIQDKVPIVRLFAARALGRLVSPDELGEFDNDTTVMQYRIALANDQNADVRKMVVMSMPPSNTTITDIVERSADVHEAVRKAVFSVIGSKFPIQSLSIRQRATVLQRGLNDRQPTVRAECIKMLIDAWQKRDCGGDPFMLLRYLDVETHESVGEAVLQELLKEGLIKVEDSAGLNDFLAQDEGTQTKSVKLLEPEQALFWRVTCGFLHSEAQMKGLEAATTGGAQALVNAADAAEKSELLEKLLPPTISEYVELVNAHLNAGPSHRFVSRNLLMLAKLLDFSDAVNRRAAANLIQDLLFEKALKAEHDVEIFRDGLHLGAEKEWASAVVELAQKVHAAAGELVLVLAEVVRELARPCREGGANAMQWLQCLGVTGLLLENLQSLRGLCGCPIDAQEIMDGLLIPAAKHIQMEVQQAGIRWLGSFCLLEDKPNMRALVQIKLAAMSGNLLVQRMALKALFDFIVCHGAAVIDRSIQISRDLRPSPHSNSPGAGNKQVPVVTGQSKNDETLGKDQPVLNFLTEMLDKKMVEDEVDDTMSQAYERETRMSVVAEGFAKLLVQNRICPEMLDKQHLIFGQLIQLYFGEETKFDVRFQQCLSVFFESYASLAASNKRCVAKAFLPVLRSEWPGLFPNRSISQGNVAARKKRATQIARFMLHLLKQKILKVQKTSGQANYTDRPEQPNKTHSDQEGDSAASRQTEAEEPDNGHEQLAITIATEVTRFPSKKSWAGKGYRELLCKVVVSLHFRASQQESIKCMRNLLDFMIEAMQGEKLICKELNAMVNRLKALDRTPEEGLSHEQVQQMLDRLGLHLERQESNPESTQPATTRTSRKVAARRSQKSSLTPDRNVQTPMPSQTNRPQRTCKTEAIQKIRSKIALESRAINFDSNTSEEQNSTTTEDGSDSADAEFETGQLQAVNPHITADPQSQTDHEFTSVNRTEALLDQLVSNSDNGTRKEENPVKDQTLGIQKQKKGGPKRESASQEYPTCSASSIPMSSNGKRLIGKRHLTTPCDMD